MSSKKNIFVKRKHLENISPHHYYVIKHTKFGHFSKRRSREKPLFLNGFMIAVSRKIFPHYS